MNRSMEVEKSTQTEEVTATTEFEKDKKKEARTGAADGCCEPECGPTTCEPGPQAVEPKAAEQPRKAKKASGGCDGSCS